MAKSHQTTDKRVARMKRRLGGARRTTDERVARRDEMIWLLRAAIKKLQEQCGDFKFDNDMLEQRLEFAKGQVATGNAKIAELEKAVEAGRRMVQYVNEQVRAKNAERKEARRLEKAAEKKAAGLRDEVIALQKEVGRLRAALQQGSGASNLLLLATTACGERESESEPGSGL